MNFVDVVLGQAKLHSNDPAIIVDNRIASFASLAQAVLRVEDRLRGLGLARGSIILIGLNDPIMHIASILACYRVGMCSLSMREGEITLPDGINPAAYLTGQSAIALPNATNVIIDASMVTGAQRPVTPSHDGIRPSELARIICSSGTTGRPKPVGFTGRDLERRMVAYLSRVSAPSWSRLLCMPGLPTNFGFSFALAALWSGRTVAFANEGNQALQLISYYGLDCCVASPQQLTALMQAQGAAGVSMVSLKSIHVGGSVLVRSMLLEMRYRLCQHIICAYGSTEGGTVAYAPSHKTAWTDGAVGFVAPWVKLEIVDESDRLLPPDTDGIIRIRSEGQGRQFNGTEFDLSDSDDRDWFYPGDRGKLQADGQLIITGRTNELINSGGVKVAPDLLEDDLKKHASILDAGVVGVMGQHGVQEVWIGAVVSDQMNAGELLEYARQVGGGTLVHRAAILPSIPRNALGKIVREELRAAIEASFQANRH